MCYCSHAQQYVRGRRETKEKVCVSLIENVNKTSSDKAKEEDTSTDTAKGSKDEDIVEKSLKNLAILAIYSPTTGRVAYTAN